MTRMLTSGLRRAYADADSRLSALGLYRTTGRPDGGRRTRPRPERCPRVGPGGAEQHPPDDQPAGPVEEREDRDGVGLVMEFRPDIVPYLTPLAHNIAT